MGTVYLVGAGPGGLFAALRLIELGKRPVVLERGKDVQLFCRSLSYAEPGFAVDSGFVP